MLQAVANWLSQRGTVPITLLFFSAIAFLIASTQFNRQLAAWTYARHPESYSLVNYEIQSAYKVKVQRSRHKATERYVKGIIGDREVETIIDRTSLSQAIFDQLENKVVREYQTKVLYASCFDNFGTNRPSIHSVHVVEPSVQGTALPAVVLDIAACNFAWLLGLVGLVTRVRYERKALNREQAACTAENEKRKRKNRKR